MELPRTTGPVARSEKRTKILLAATFTVEALTQPCRIRDMSCEGAMAETGSAPSVGTQIILRRGTLQATAVVAWSRAAAFGIRFASPIAYQDWLEEPHELNDKNLTKGSIAAYISSAVPPPEPPSSQPFDETQFLGRMAEEISYVARMLQTVGELLIKDPMLRSRHHFSLQNLDVGQQMLTELAAVVVAPDERADSIKRLVTGPMRDRLLRRNMF